MKRLKARLILTFDCPRHCPNCANDQIAAIAAIPRVATIRELDIYDEIILTGGEPMLDPEATLGFVLDLKTRRMARTVYLYTALWSPAIHDLLRIVDGIHYTIHAPTLPGDDFGLASMHVAISEARHHGDLSCRLCVDADVREPVTIYPYIWDRVEIARFKEDCPVPAGETLLVWGGTR